ISDYNSGHSRILLLNHHLQTVGNFPGYLGDLAFDPSSDRLFVADLQTQKITALDPLSGQVLYRLDFGEQISSLGRSGAFDSGQLTFSSDGRRLFLTTPSGIRVFDVSGKARDNDMTLTAGQTLTGADFGVDPPPRIVPSAAMSVSESAKTGNV